MAWNSSRLTWSLPPRLSATVASTDCHSMTGVLGKTCSRKACKRAFCRGMLGSVNAPFKSRNSWIAGDIVFGIGLMNPGTMAAISCCRASGLMNVRNDSSVEESNRGPVKGGLTLNNVQTSGSSAHRLIVMPLIFLARFLHLGLLLPANPSIPAISPMDLPVFD